MKTLQEHLAVADRGRLLDCLSYRFLDDPLHLLELKSHTVQDIQDRYCGYMNGFIELLLKIDAVQSANRVYYLYTSYGKNEVLDLIDITEIREDPEAPGHDFSFTEWQESLGYMVADTKFTQDRLTDLLAQYLEEASFFGTDESSRTAKLEEIVEQLDRGVQSMRDNEAKPAEDVFEELRKEYEFPSREKDDSQDRLHEKVISAIADYDRYCRLRERKRILEETVKT